MLKFKYCILKIFFLILWTIQIESYGECRYRILEESGCSNMFEYFKKKHKEDTNTEDKTECIKRIGFR